MSQTFLADRQERRQNGKTKRNQVPFESHAQWEPAKDRPDPIKLLQEKDAGRLKFLLPIKYGRMVSSPFSFFRGSAALMASDLANTPVSGIEAILCGDAHLSNFGIFASPERSLIFDINDFDECYPGPWEWDLKRLVASVVVAGMDNRFKDKDNRKLAKVAVHTYRKAMNEFSQMPTLEVWYYHVNARKLLDFFEKHTKEGAKVADKAIKKARLTQNEQTLKKLTNVVDGKRQFIYNPPLMVPLKKINKQKKYREEIKITEEGIREAWNEYLKSLPLERQMLLSRFKIVDGALRVVGVGSVGTRCSVLLLESGLKTDAIILQQKEAGHSALEPYLRQRNYASQAQRVVIGQRLMQATNDIFLGWSRSSVSFRQYYWRQLKDMKASINVKLLDPQGLATYIVACSFCLAHAHARTGDASGISGYMGKGYEFDDALTEFALKYADQNLRDYQALKDAADSGRIETKIEDK
ncbi:MAG: DUF2252 domain-containing protein [Candidatus Bathyarchaeum sp.]|nr:MAG: DUF2252 domain-containing protein [Candidatus Bathyarchaeum sp.]